MQDLDLHYLCRVIGNHSSIPIRIFVDDTLDFYHSAIYLSKDPLELNRDEILRTEGKVGYFVPSVGKAVTLRFDKEKLPYIGVWVNNGRFKEMYNIAMEIATSPFDKPETAIERGIDFKIPAGQSFKFDITVTVE